MQSRDEQLCFSPAGALLPQLAAGAYSGACSHCDSSHSGQLQEADKDGGGEGQQSTIKHGSCSRSSFQGHYYCQVCDTTNA